MGKHAKAANELKAARKALEENSRRERKAGVRSETPRFNRLNSRVVEAQKNVPWWRR